MRLQLILGGLAALVVVPGSASAQGRTRVAADALYYTDTDNVMAVSPSLSARHRFEDGGSVGVRAGLDVVTAASVDVVSHATNRFEEVRGEVGFELAVPFDDALFSASYRGSYEPDYLSNGVGLGLRLRLGSPDSVLDVGYRLSGDIVGRVETSLEAFSEELFTHGASLSLTQNLGPETVLRLIYTPTVQHGYLEKPYRYVPLFDSTGQRLAYRVPENVPDLRHGHAVGARLLQYLEPIGGSLRIDYQFYVDNWGVTSHVVEAAGLATIVEGLRVGLRGRFYGQTAASFWERDYTVVTSGTIPRWRTLDRDLSPYLAVTGAARIEWGVDHFAGYVDGGVTYTHFEDFSLLDERVAIVTQIGLRWTP